MRHAASLFFVLVLAGCAVAAHASECNSLASMQWLLGEWRAEGGKTTWSETWTEINAKTWEGRGVEALKAAPGKQSTEELRLVEMGGSVFYLAKVTHNELPIPFRLDECGDDRLVFANPAHDFPRRLDYERRPDGRLLVRVSDGADKGFTLDFARQPAVAVDSAAVLTAEDARFEAMVAADPQGMGRWFAEDLAYVHSTGAVQDRGQLIDAILGGEPRYIAVTPSERRVFVMGPDAAVVQGRARFQIEAGGRRLDFEARYLAVYGLEAGAWRLRAWQSLRMP